MGLRGDAVSRQGKSRSNDTQDRKCASPEGLAVSGLQLRCASLAAQSKRTLFIQDSVTMAKRVLIIEDEPGQITILGIRLKALGYETASARDGEEGLKKAQSWNPDIILLDILIPKLDGFEVCRRLKRSPQTAKVPVIMFTALDDLDILQKSREANADDLIRKPYASGELISKIKTLLAD